MNINQHGQSPAPIDERAEFEKWFNTQDYSADVRTWAWNGFRAARKLSAPVLADETKKLYEELIYSVASKFPDETRHQTALRYIRNAEKGTSEKADQTRLQFSMLKSSPVSYSANASDAPQVSPVVPDDCATPIPHDEKRIDFLEAHPELQIKRYKKNWSVSTFSNYERDMHKTLREAIDAAMLKGEK